MLHQCTHKPDIALQSMWGYLLPVRRQPSSHSPWSLQYLPAGQSASEQHSRHTRSLQQFGLVASVQSSSIQHWLFSMQASPHGFFPAG